MLQDVPMPYITRSSFTSGFSQPGIAALLEGWEVRGGHPFSAWETPDICWALADWEGAGFQPVPAAWLLLPQKAEQKQGNSAPKQPALHVLPDSQSTDFNCMQAARESKARTGGQSFHQMSRCHQLHKVPT